nr:hypothetical protein C4D60_Mb03t03480 [Ipomoea batatas]
MCKALSAVVATDFLIGDEGEVDGADRLESRNLEAANRFQVLEADAFHVLGAPSVDVTGGAIDLGAKRRVRPLVRLGRDDVGVGFRLRDYEIRRFSVPWLGLGGVDSEVCLESRYDFRRRRRRRKFTFRRRAYQTKKAGLMERAQNFIETKKENYRGFDYLIMLKPEEVEEELKQHSRRIYSSFSLYFSNVCSSHYTARLLLPLKSSVLTADC